MKIEGVEQALRDQVRGLGPDAFHGERRFPLDEHLHVTAVGAVHHAHFDAPGDDVEPGHADDGVEHRREHVGPLPRERFAVGPQDRDVAVVVFEAAEHVFDVEQRIGKRPRPGILVVKP